MERSRRSVLEMGAGTLVAGVIAGCSTDDPDSGDDDGSGTDPAGDDDSNGSDPGEDGDGSDPEGGDANDGTEPETRSLELLAEENVDHGHACLHAEFDERTPLEAAGSIEESPTESDTHIIWEVTYEGDAGYVRFDADDHTHDGAFVFYTADGSARPVVGTEIEQDTVPDEDCSDLDEYIRVEPEEGQIGLELTTAE